MVEVAMNGAARATQPPEDAVQKILHNESSASQPPYQVLQSQLPFDDTMTFWWETSAIVLSKLMTKANYPLEIHYRNLLFYYDKILSAYGPIPLGKDTRQWHATITPDASACEPSMNLRTTGTSESVVRFTIEANSTSSGNSMDPLNQHTSSSVIEKVAEWDPTFNLTIWNYLRSQLFFSDEEATKLRKEYPNHLAPQCYLAFDFEKDGQILGKASPFFFWKCKQTGQTPREVASQIISGIPVIGGDLKEPLAALETCLKAFPEEYGGEPRPECMGFDFLAPDRSSRIKVYSRLWKSSFAALSHFWTLGGVLHDSATLKGLELLKLFWQTVFKHDEDDKELEILHEGWADLVINFELKPGEALPRPKVYLPVWKYVPTEADVCERLAEFWRRVGWNEQAENYQHDWQETFPWLDANGHGGMNYVSLAYKDKESGMYMSLYFSPKVHTAAGKLGHA
ncbi:tryptophan dimethylallyltransferase-domain-containing protein [Lophiotrema nucula]|uniref:Tryptophan dimethylallyltransferase-domain-containing protein n=1 Tax=Lophiotrema nucula TaxID=690887 RepID=A0A6A5ZGJ3_9PLEO|nr:tryptophan dimethylallyltransferase-domain-containing protein [Lophiotrema nucula]